MKLPFTKMHGLGNDFVVFDFTQNAYSLSKQQAIQIADRHFGVGCDQILIVENTTRQELDFKYRILNADGSEVGQCGNGARCFAQFVRDQGLTDKSLITVETITGDLVLEVDQHSKLVTANLGVPNFEPSSVPINQAERNATYAVNINDTKIEFSAVSIGNPHAVIQVENVATAPVLSLGKALESHALFPERANIGFMQVHNREQFSVRVYERGVGETIACGSGACAAAVCAMQLGLMDSVVNAHLTGGDLKIAWQGEGQAVMLTGPAVTVFAGEIEV